MGERTPYILYASYALCTVMFSIMLILSNLAQLIRFINFLMFNIICQILNFKSLCFIVSVESIINIFSLKEEVPSEFFFESELLFF